MAINPIDDNDSEVRAQQLARSGNLNAEDRGKLIAKYGAEKVNQWLSVDSIKYQITDEEKTTAKANGREQAEAADGDFDGKADNGKSTVASVNNVAAGAAGAVAGVISYLPNLVANIKTAMNGWWGAIVASCGAVLLANALAIKCADYNGEPADACEKMTDEMGTAQQALDDAQQTMQESTDKTVELGAEAEEKNEDANTLVEEDKIIFDDRKTKYELLKNKKNSGKDLTSEEKSNMKLFARDMKTSGEEINTTIQTTSEEVGALNDEIAEEEDVYKTAGETMAEVEGATEYMSEFDEDTVSNTKALKTTSYIGMAGAAGVVAAGGKVIATSSKAGLIGTWFEIAMGGLAIAEGIASGIVFGNVISKQGEYQNIAENAVSARKTTEDLNKETNDAYEEMVDGYAGTRSVVEKLELNKPDNMTFVEDNTGSSGSGNTQGAGGGNTQGAGGGNAQTRGVNNGNQNELAGDSGDKTDDDKKSKDVK